METYYIKKNTSIQDNFFYIIGQNVTLQSFLNVLKQRKFFQNDLRIDLIRVNF